jgi:hypothetical protein
MDEHCKHKHVVTSIAIEVVAGVLIAVFPLATVIGALFSA